MLALRANTNPLAQSGGRDSATFGDLHALISRATAEGFVFDALVAITFRSALADIHHRALARSPAFATSPADHWSGAHPTLA